jgi:hypothetical protein
VQEITKTANEIEDFFRLLVCTILQLDPEKNHSRIRFPWGSNLAFGIPDAPDWDRMEDVCFIYALPYDDPYNKQRNRRNIYIEGPDMIQLDEHTNVHNMLFVNYGPNAYEDARKIRDGMFRNPIRRLLRRNHFALVTDIAAPRRVPELYNNEWWNRVDVNVIFNEFVRLKDEMRTIRHIRFGVSFPNRNGNDTSAGAEIRRPACKENRINKE